MKRIQYLEDADFLRELDNQNNRFYQVKIEVLNKDETPIKCIEGRVLPGSSINIDGSSSMRRTCSISLVAEDEENNLTDVDNLLSINKKIRIFEGIKNDINETYEDIIWFPLGIFVIIQPSISHSAGGCTISLSCKDKMCLLNGECGGNLPTSVTFHAYDQIIGEIKCGSSTPEQYVASRGLEPKDYIIYTFTTKENNQDVEKCQTWTKGFGQSKILDDKDRSLRSQIGTRVEVKQTFYDIIQTLVCNYGGEALERIFINDVPLEIKQLVRQTGNNTLYYKASTSQYTLDSGMVDDNQQKEFNYNEDVGYVYTPFTYADLGGGNGQLISNIGDNVCTILDKIKNNLGNFEYFYDVNGNFVFQEIKNYLNNSYDPKEDAAQRLDNNDRSVIDVTGQGLCILDEVNYPVDFYHNTKSIYTFEEGSGLITSYSNSPNYNNLKNDFHIQGKASDNYAIHYHLVIKAKPVKNIIVYNTNGQIDHYEYPTYNVVFLEDDKGNLTGGLRLATSNDSDSSLVKYTPQDQRAELYLQGLEIQAQQGRPDVYQQELLDLFDSIYDFSAKVFDDEGNFLHYGKFKTDMVKNPNDLKYFIDYLEPVDELFDCSIDTIGQKIYSYQKDNIKKLYDMEVPDRILIDISSSPEEQEEIIERCIYQGQLYSNVNSNIYSKLAIGTMGYTAQEVSRDLLYQYTDYAESITIQSIPIYYLEPNTRITVNDQKSGIHGDYIIKNISLPLDAGGAMSISATHAYERI